MTALVSTTLVDWGQAAGGGRGWEQWQQQRSVGGSSSSSSSNMVIGSAAENGAMLGDGTCEPRRHAVSLIRQKHFKSSANQMGFPG